MQTESEATILEYQWLVKAIAARLIMSLPACVQADDLVSVGNIALIDAIGRFDPKRGAQFRTFAKHRIRGGMLDHLRGVDILSRHERNNVNALERAQEVLRSRIGRDPSEGEMAAELGVTSNKVRRMIEWQHRGIVRDGIPDKIRQATPDPGAGIHLKEIARHIEAAIDSLPPRYATLVRMYWQQDKTMQECAVAFGLTEGRISQMHKKALNLMREFLLERGLDYRDAA